MAAATGLRMEIYNPIVTLIVALVSSVYLFEQLEQERTDRRIGKTLFAISSAIMVYFAFKEQALVSERDVKLLYGFLMVAICIVVYGIIQDNP